MKTQINGQSNRILEIDFIKAFCILAMILVHCYEELYDGGGSGTSTLFVDIFNVIIGASAFMFCMGFTSNIKHNAVPKYDIFRGIGLLSVGMFLNFLRSPVARLIIIKSHGLDFYCIGLIDAAAVDIMQFAGLAFILLGILRHLKINPWGIFLISLAMGGIGTLLRFTDVGNPVGNCILAYFIGSNADSYFPLFHWFVFVAAGNLYMEYYTKIENKPKFYAMFLPITSVLTATYVTLAALKIGPFQVLSKEIYYTWMNPIDAIGCIISILTYMGVMWLLAQLVQKIDIKIKPLSYLAQNINTLYCIHWVLLMFIEYWIFDVFEILPWPESDIMILIYMISFLFLSIGICEFYKKYMRSQVHAFLARKPLFWVVIPFILTIICVAISIRHGLTEIPSFINSYKVGDFYM